MPFFTGSCDTTIVGGNLIDVGAVHFHLSETTVDSESAERSDRSRFLSSLVDRLPSSPARYDSAERSFASRCLLGTRVELLQTIDAWVNDDSLDHPRIFWLSGLAGIGKSTIAQTVAELCAGRNILGASFFFDRRDARRSDPKLLFTTLARQLAQFSPAFLTAIAEAVEESRDLTDTAIEIQLRDFVIAPLSKASQHPPLVVVVIDALDEGENRQEIIRQLLRHLAAEIYKVPFPLKFFITSRPEPGITTEFSLPLMKPVSQAFILHSIDTSVVQDDIRRFLEHHLVNIRPSPDWPSNEQLDTLISKTAGLFIFAKTSLDFIGRYGPAAARERLDIVLQVEKDDSLSPYASLDRLYMKVLETAISMDDDEYSSLLTHFQLVVGAVVLLFEPSPMSMLERLLGERQGCAKSVLLQLGSVIILPESNDGDVRVWHQSFVDFLTNLRRCPDPRFFINPKDHHHRLALACLKCMRNSLRRNICSITNSSKLNSEIDDLPARLEQNISRELRYSCFHWSSHVSQSFSVGNTLTENLDSFCFQHLLHWIEVLSLFGELSLAIPALTNAREWCEVSGSTLREQFRLTLDLQNAGMDSNLITILGDAERFVLRFFEPISQSAQHVYHSALPFTPRATLLALKYADDLQSTVRVKGSVEENWNPCLQVLSPKTGSKRHGAGSLALSADGQWLFVATDDVLEMMHIVTGARQHTFKLGGSDSTIYCIALSPDNSYVACGLRNGNVEVWSVVTGLRSVSIEGHVSEVSSVAFSPDSKRIVSRSRQEVRIWDATEAVLLLTLTSKRTLSSNILFSPDGSQIVIGRRTHVAFWCSQTGKLQTKFDVPYLRSISQIIFSPNGQYLAMCGDTIDYTLGIRAQAPVMQIWDYQLGAVHKVIQQYEEGTGLAFSPDSMRIASASSSEVLIWDVLSGRKLNQVDASCFIGKPVSYSMAWTRALPASLFPESSYVKVVSFSPDGRNLVVESTDGEMRVLDCRAIEQTSDGIRVQPEKAPVESVRVSEDGSRLVSVSGEVCSWDIQNGICLASRQEDVKFATISLDGQLICSVIDSYPDASTAIIWNGTTGATLTTLKVHHPHQPNPSDLRPELTISKFLLAAFFPDGTRIVTFACHSMGSIHTHCVAHEVTVWSCNNDKSLSKIMVDSVIKPGTLAVSPDMNQVYFQLCHGIGHIWDLDSGLVLTTASDCQDDWHPLDSFWHSPDWNKPLHHHVNDSDEEEPDPEDCDCGSSKDIPNARWNIGARTNFVTSLENGWVTVQVKGGCRAVRLFWLPHEYRYFSSPPTVHDATYISGTSDGRVVFIDFSGCQLE